jgi:hypothetical protein
LALKIISLKFLDWETRKKAHGKDRCICVHFCSIVFCFQISFTCSPWRQFPMTPASSSSGLLSLCSTKFTIDGPRLSLTERCPMTGLSFILTSSNLMPRPRKPAGLFSPVIYVSTMFLLQFSPSLSVGYVLKSIYHIWVGNTWNAICLLKSSRGLRIVGRRSVSAVRVRARKAFCDMSCRRPKK